MKTKLFIIAILVTGIAQCILSCKKEKTTNPVSQTLVLPDTPYDYLNGENDIATAGRVLFYDTRISVNNSISCASCHKQAIAFSDNVALSSGFENRKTTRNTPPIQNLIDNSFGTGFGPTPTTELFWDGRESLLSSLVLKPILNHVEMGMGSEAELVAKVNSLPEYADLFQKAFGTTRADGNSIAKALSTFTGSIRSDKSRFDQSSMGISALNALEQQGQELFSGKYNCQTCHSLGNSRGYDINSFDPINGNVDNSSAFRNIGLDANYADNGRGAITGNAVDNGKFKIPNLRNVALTAPYMHDGRFKTLAEVMNHYSSGISPNPNLDMTLEDHNGSAARLNITSADKKAMIAFLNSLTDFDMITDPKFSNPFRVN